MFYDEKIHNNKGEAFRKTVFLAEILLIVYAVLHLVYNSVYGVQSFSSVVTELFSSIFGLILIVYGEIKYGIRSLNEIQQNSKNSYYANSFFRFLYFFIFVYCIITPFTIMNLPAYSWPPVYLMFFLEIPCWLLLLLSLKSKNVSLNAEFIQEDSKTYRTRVCMNILKFGGFCAVFTVISLIFSLLYLIVIHKEINLFTLTFVISVLLLGLLIWVSFSIEYIILSITERISDKAQEHNRISIIVLIFAILMALFNIVSPSIRIYATIRYGANSSQAVMLINSVQKYFEWSACYFSGLFAVFLMSEMKNRVAKAFSKITSAYVVTLIASYCYSIVYPFIINIIYEINNGFGEDIRLLNTVATISGFITVIFSLSILIISICALSLLKKAGIAKSWLYIYPVAVFLTSNIQVLLASILQRSSSSSTVTVMYFVSILLHILFIAGFCSVYHSVNRKTDQQLDYVSE